MDLYGSCQTFSQEKRNVHAPFLTGFCDDDNTDPPTSKLMKDLCKCAMQGDEYGVLSASLDGSKLQDLNQYRTQTKFFNLTIPKDNFCDCVIEPDVLTIFECRIGVKQSLTPKERLIVKAFPCIFLRANSLYFKPVRFPFPSLMAENNNLLPPTSHYYC